ncbi:hypothetical protein JFY74_02525 [Pectobacterium carotovorum]|nr:hypothetical protein JFY74_02525 [Pectobacterium carotovorum]
MFFSLERFGVPSPAADVAAAQRLYSNGKKREIGWMDLQWNYSGFWNGVRRSSFGFGNGQDCSFILIDYSEKYYGVCKNDGRGFFEKTRIC